MSLKVLRRVIIIITDIASQRRTAAKQRQRRPCGHDEHDNQSMPKTCRDLCGMSIALAAFNPILPPILEPALCVRKLSRSADLKALNPKTLNPKAYNPITLLSVLATDGQLKPSGASTGGTPREPAAQRTLRHC